MFPKGIVLDLAREDNQVRAAKPASHFTVFRDDIVEQDHRTVKCRSRLAMGYGSFHSAWRTLQGIEAVNLIRKGRVRG